MGGFWIYVGPSLSEQTIQTRLENYSEPQNIELETEEDITLAREIQNFQIRDDGIISFDFHWGEMVYAEGVDGTVSYQTDHNLNSRIIRRDDSLFFLIEKKLEVPFHMMLSRIDSALYGSATIGKVFISSDSVREILNLDADWIIIEHFERLSDREHWLGVSGDLSRRDDDGNISSSEIHERYHDRPYTSVSFHSAMLGTTLWIKRGKLLKDSSSVSSPSASLNGIERYIRELALPRMTLESLGD